MIIKNIEVGSFLNANLRRINDVRKIPTNAFSLSPRTSPDGSIITTKAKINQQNL